MNIAPAELEGCAASQPGWQGHLNLVLRSKLGKTVLAETRRYGPLSVQRPFYPGDGACHIYLLHPPGGVVGGDVLKIEVEAGAHTNTLFTTPGATKFYRSAGSAARQVQEISALDGATVTWLPQENIHFAGCAVQLQTRIRLEGSARLRYWEMQCFGRPASGEAFDHGEVDSHLVLSRDGSPLLIERQRVDPLNMTRRALMAGNPVSGLFIASHTSASQFQACRSGMVVAEDENFGMTLIEDLLVARYLGGSTEQARDWMTSLWTKLNSLSDQRPQESPRIWKT